MRIRQPVGQLLLPIVADLGAGEREVLALGTEKPESLVVLDDGLARRYARLLT
jgi:predicted nucleic acid-binding protein